MTLKKRIIPEPSSAYIFHNIFPTSSHHKCNILAPCIKSQKEKTQHNITIVYINRKKKKKDLTHPIIFI